MKGNIYWMFFLTVIACGSGNTPIEEIGTFFETAVSAGEVENTAINEASGIAEGINNPGKLWTHNDSGDSPRIFLMDENGKDERTYYLKGVENRDWEDIASGPGPEADKSYLYIAETGDNIAQFTTKYIYRIVEPTLDGPDTVEWVDKITFEYPDGKRDAECLLLDPLTRDLYVVSKRENQVAVYRAAYPQSTTETIMLEKLGNIPFNNIVGGDISANGMEILMKTYNKIFYWKRDKGQEVMDALLETPMEIPYTIEPQGEAIAWKKDGTGFFTLSEEVLGLEAVLYFYKRK